MTTGPRRFRSFPAVLAALLFVGLAALPWIHATSGTPPWVAAAKAASPVAVLKGPLGLPKVQLAPTAQPIQPKGPVAKPPSGDPTYLPVLVTSEENRLRLMLHSTAHMTVPGIVDFPSSVATLILPARAAPYTFSDLVRAGAAIPWTRPKTYLLVDSVFVAPSASLQIGGADLSALLMNTSPGRFTSIVAWEGTVALVGTAKQPLQVTGWNNGPATDPNLGRPYIRAVGGQLTLTDVRASSLGFWSGPTGGVSWTATSYRPATGGASGSSFTGDTYGAFATGSLNVQFSDDLFESNQVDGIRLESNSDNSTITGSAAVRNGGNGFAVSQGSNDSLTFDVAVHNAGNGFLLDAQPLISAASFSGSQQQPDAGLVLAHTEANSNGRAGILVEGGSGTEVRDDSVCNSTTGIAVRLGAVDTAIVGNDISCGTRIGLAVGPAVVGTLVASNSISHSHIGVMIESSPKTRLLNNNFSNMSVFGVSVRGSSQGVVGDHNTIAGRGYAPVQTAYGATTPVLTATDVTGWSRRTTVTVLDYLRYHPLLMTWTIILALVALFCIFTRFRRRSALPYHHVVPWSLQGDPVAPIGELSKGPDALEPDPPVGRSGASPEPGPLLEREGRAILVAGVASPAVAREATPELQTPVT